MREDSGRMRAWCLSVCVGSVLLVGCDDSSDDDRQAQAVGLATASRPAPNPQKASLSIKGASTTPTALPTTPRYELFSIYAGQDIKQVTGVSGRTLWLCFTAPWCPHSRQMINELKELARSEKGNVQVVQLDADAYPAIAEEFGITKVPTTALYAEGVKLRTIEGAYNAASLQRFLHSVLSRDPSEAAEHQTLTPKTNF